MLFGCLYLSSFLSLFHWKRCVGEDFTFTQFWWIKSTIIREILLLVYFRTVEKLAETMLTVNLNEILHHPHKRKQERKQKIPFFLLFNRWMEWEEWMKMRKWWKKWDCVGFVESKRKQQLINIENYHHLEPLKGKLKVNFM